MENIGIQNPCHENWANMTPNEQGAFCGSCQKTVADWSHKSTREVFESMQLIKGSSTCVRMEVDQYQSVVNLYNELQYSKVTQTRMAGFLAVFLVFGCSLFAAAQPQTQAEINSLHQRMQSAVIYDLTNDGPGDTLQQKNKLQTPEVDSLTQIDLPEVHIRGARAREIETHEYIMGAYYVPTQYEVEQLPQPVVLDKNGLPIPEHFSALLFPNPTKGNSQIKLALPQADTLSFQLVDMTGRILQTFDNRSLEAGTHAVRFNFALKTNGLYLLHIAGEHYQEAIQFYFED